MILDQIYISIEIFSSFLLCSFCKNSTNNVFNKQQINPINNKSKKEYIFTITRNFTEDMNLFMYKENVIR